MPSSGPKYDVAISFLAKDEPIAASICDKLGESLRVFFFPRNQEDLAGTNGLESMRTPFLSDSRLVVVLYREAWGNTPWTGVESTAIQEGCLNKGWNRLFFVALDITRSFPVWLRQTHVRFNYLDFGLEQAVGAIKARVQENGGVLEPLTALKRAKMYEQEKQYIRDKDAMNSPQGIDSIHKNVREVFAEIVRLCSEINTQGHPTIRVGTNDHVCVLTDDRISLIVVWNQRYTNALDGAMLVFREFNRRMQLPDEPHLMFMSEPKMLKESVFFPELSRSREYGWIKRGNSSEFLSASALAEKCLIGFLDLAERNEKGKVERPGW